MVNPTGNNPWIVPNNGAADRDPAQQDHQFATGDLPARHEPRGIYGCQSVEIYDNAFSAVGLKTSRPQGFISIGAGVAIVFNNTVTGTTYNMPPTRTA